MKGKSPPSIQTASARQRKEKALNILMGASREAEPDDATAFEMRFIQATDPCV